MSITFLSLLLYPITHILLRLLNLRQLISLSISPIILSSLLLIFPNLLLLIISPIILLVLSNILNFIPPILVQQLNTMRCFLAQHVPTFYIPIVLTPILRSVLSTNTSYTTVHSIIYSAGHLTHLIISNQSTIIIIRLLLLSTYKLLLLVMMVLLLFLMNHLVYDLAIN